MSCNLKQTSLIADIPAIRKILFPLDEENNQRDEEKEKDGWDAESWMDDWGVDSKENNEEEMDSSEENSSNWLHKCHFAFSPTYDLMAMAKEDKMVLLTARSDSGSAVSRSSSFRKYKLSAQPVVSDEPIEKVTSLLCVPLVSLKKTSFGSVDWSCVLVGFNTGFVKMFTESGALLISQMFHESPVIELKCRTHDPGGTRSRSFNSDQTDEVTVLYSDALIILDGFCLFQTLRACRSQVAIAAASGGMTIEPPPMSYKKWKLTGGQNPVSSHISPGIQTPSAFDQMRTASILGGYTAEIRGTAPATSCFVASGVAPFIGYYYAVEGSTQPHLSHVALAVASKLKSALYSSASRWLAWGTGTQPEPVTQQKHKPKVELGAPLDIRCGMPDPLRHGDKILLAPGACLSSSALAATTDNLGRVILMDVARAVALRMWKGYRDAQVGFMRVFDDAHRSQHQYHRSHTDATAQEENSKSVRKHALFLLIYAPRRGLLEVWTCINGPRVGAFNVSKNARLLCPGYSMMGLSTSTVPVATAHSFQCCLLEESGQIREVKIPFHLALSDANSKKARDMHLLKKLTILLHSRRKTGEEAVKILLEIRISGMLRQALEKLLHTRKIGAGIFRSCISAIQDRLQEGGALKKEDNDLLKFCEAQKDLIAMYEAIQKLNESGFSEHGNVVMDIEHVTNVDEICNLLHMTRTEAADALHTVARFRESQQKPQVRFSDKELTKQSLDVAEFLDCFAFRDVASEGAARAAPSMHLNLSDQMKSSKIAGFLFHATLYGSAAPDDILFTLHSCIDLDPRTILSLLFQHWLQQDDVLTDNLANSIGKLYMFVEASNRKSMELSKKPGDDGEVSDVWDWVREDVCAPSCNIVAAYFLAIVTRAVAIASNAQNRKDDEEKSEDGDDWESMQIQEAEEAMEEAPPPSYQDSCAGENPDKKYAGEWETLWIDIEKWNLFVHQLEDCLLINTAINLGKIFNQTEPKEDHCTGSADDINSKTKTNNRKATEDAIELQDQDDNKGVSVKDLLSNGPGFMAELISHSICQLNISPHLLRKQDETERLPSSEAKEHQQKFLDFLHETLYIKFPYSLATDCLHSHCFWELVVEWNKEPMEIRNFISAIDHLHLVKNDPHARHGLAVMAWKTFVSKRYLALAKLVDKVGKAPKDRLCRKDVGISDVLMATFCQACTEILQTIADADLDLVPSPGDNEVVDMSGGAEDPWQAITGKRSIMDMGRAHSHAHYGLVQHSMHLCFVLHATMEFSLRGVKPLSALFDRRGRSCFTLDLTNKDPALPNPDSIDLSINKARQQFLTKVVTAAVQHLAEKILHKDKESMTIQGSKQACKEELEKWIETAVHMASEFQINVEKVKMHHVDELFRNGLDAIGLEACATVSDKEVLSSSLVLIVGQRLSYVLLHARPDDGVMMMSRMPPMLSTWIKSQDSSLLKRPDVPIDDTLNLARTVLTMMNENHSQYNMALFLEEAASAMSSP